MKNEYIDSKKRRTFLLGGVSALLLPQVVQAKPNPYGIKGHQAPELEVSQWIDGKGKPTTFKIANHKGKFIFMEFWQAWCPGCHKHGFPALKKISDEFKDNKHFEAIAIQTTFEGFSVNNAKQMRAIQMRYDLNLTFGHDEGKEGTHPHTMRSYRSGGTPWAVLISPEGKVIYNDFSIDPASAIAYLKKEIAKIGS